MDLHLDPERLRKGFHQAQPFPYVVLEDFLPIEAAREVSRSYPTFDEAERMGLSFAFVNERKKVQVTDYERFPGPVKALADALASPEFMGRLEALTGIEGLLWDDSYAGGGMHQTASSGHLDVHVDFNQLGHNGWYRRLNLLIYLNERWDPEWGGHLELWDQEVKNCYQRVVPALGRAVLFETSDHSFHGVSAVESPEDHPRKSFAVYYYAKQPGASFEGSHSTIFKARPHELKKKYISMPLERAERLAQDKLRSVKDQAKRFLGR